MHLVADISLTSLEACTYLPDREMRLQYFLADSVTSDELESLLATGWRKFGQFFFRPQCPACRECVPVRVLADRLKLSRSQRKIRNRNRTVDVHVGPLAYRDEIYDVYRDHSLHKFGKQTSRDEFVLGFYHPTCPALQSEYFVNGRLAAVGFLDRSSRSLSSVYFAYHDFYKRRGLGVFSVLAEAQLARSLGLRNYYLGYWVKANSKMNYKGRFKPHERYDWARGEWVAMDGSAVAGPAICNTQVRP